ncbi:MAG TPA: hypothetical protein DCE71_07870 [Parachlamydiales bacterium]|nr:hypothetical protein [Parachlamydiales bacterium]
MTKEKPRQKRDDVGEYSVTGVGFLPEDVKVSVTQKKPREFWIEIWKEQPADSDLIIQRPVSARNFNKSCLGDEIIHVIEYSAYESLKKENEQLKAKLEKAKEALLKLSNEVAAMVATHGDVIANDYGRTNLECLEHRLSIARATLEELEGEK